MKFIIKHKYGYKVKDINRRKAIKEKCFNCSCWKSKEVRNCKHTDCQLYTFRLGDGKQDAKVRNRAIKDYCLWCMNGKHSEVVRCVSTTCPLFPFRLKNLDRSVEIPSIVKKRSYSDHLKEEKEHTYMIDYGFNSKIEKGSYVA